MKKIILLSIILLTLSASFVQAGSFITDKAGNLVLHTYQSGDPLGDVSFIIESENSLVILEPVPFKANIKELLAYTEKLAKPITKIIVAFHPAGLAQYPQGDKVITKPLEGFVHSDAGKGMLKHFEKAFKGAMDVELVPFDTLVDAGKTLVIDGVTYQFTQTKMPGMPGSNITINGQIHFTHFAAAQNVHPSVHYINSPKALAAALAESKDALKSGCHLFIGSHMPGRGEAKDLEFQIKYLETLTAAASETDEAAEIVARMEKAFPGCANGQNLKAIAEKL